MTDELQTLIDTYGLLPVIETLADLAKSHPNDFTFERTDFPMLTRELARNRKPVTC